MAVGAPAVVMLATVVNAAAASDQALATAPAQDLSWVLKGGATPAGRGTRAFLAHKAATTIHSLDRLSGAACAPFCTVAAAPLEVYEWSPAPFVLAPALRPAHSSHQHSAP